MPLLTTRLQPQTVVILFALSAYPVATKLRQLTNISGKYINPKSINDLQVSDSVLVNEETTSWCIDVMEAAEWIYD